MVGQSSEIPQSHKMSFLRRFRSQFFECGLEGEELIGTFVRHRQVDQLNTTTISSMLGSAFSARLVDEDSLHGLGCGAEKMATANPALSLVNTYQAKIRIVY